MRREFSRQNLYDLVWQQPLKTLAKTMDISDVRLAKICRQANIPLPGVGYWAKRAHGKPTRQLPLPSRGLGQSDEVTVGGSRWAEPLIADVEVLHMQIPAPPSFEENIASVTVRARKLVGQVPKSKSLKQPHPLISKLLEDDEQRRLKALESSWHWDKPKFDSPIEKRRLRLINRLAWTFSKGQMKFDILGKDAGSFCVTVGDESVHFTLDPPGTERVDGTVRPVRGKRNADILELKLSWYQPPDEILSSWIDSEELSLEEQLTDIAVGLLVAGECMYRSRRIRRREWLLERKQTLVEKARRLEEERQRKEREAILELERARREKLLSHAVAWNQAGLVREFVQAALRQPQLSNDSTPLSEWATWALAEADRIDPLNEPIEFLIAIPNERLEEA